MHIAIRHISLLGAGFLPVEIQAHAPINAKIRYYLGRLKEKGIYSRRVFNGENMVCCIAGNIGGELNLAVLETNRQFKICQYIHV